MKRILASLRGAADEAGVQIVTGDTKVVQKGSADRVFINTSGIGVIESPIRVSASRAAIGDKVIVSGSSGDHATTIMIARGEFELETDLESDSAPLNLLVSEILPEAEQRGSLDAIHCRRDPTRGGVATTLNEMVSRPRFTFESSKNRYPFEMRFAARAKFSGSIRFTSRTKAS